MTDLLDKFVQRFGRLPTETDPDYLEMLRMSKYRVLPVADTQPGKCANCGASKRDGRSYVDFGLDIPWFGTIYLCSLCLEDIARNVGLFDSLNKRLNEADERADKNAALLAKGEELRVALTNGFEGVREYFDTVGVRTTGNDSSPDSSAVLDDYTPSDRAAAGESTRPANEAKQRAVKPAPSSGSKDLLSLTERLQAGNKP